VKTLGSPYFYYGSIQQVQRPGKSGLSRAWQRRKWGRETAPSMPKLFQAGF